MTTIAEEIDAAIKSAVTAAVAEKDAVIAEKNAIIDKLSDDITAAKVALENVVTAPSDLAVKVKGILDSYAHDIIGKATFIFNDVRAAVEKAV